MPPSQIPHQAKCGNEKDGKRNLGKQVFGNVFIKVEKDLFAEP